MELGQVVVICGVMIRQGVDIALDAIDVQANEPPAGVDLPEMQQLFEAMDANHDGVLSREEFEQAMRMKQQMERQELQDGLGHSVATVVGSTTEVPAEPMTHVAPGPNMVPVTMVPMQCQPQMMVAGGPPQAGPATNDGSCWRPTTGSRYSTPNWACANGSTGATDDGTCRRPTGARPPMMGPASGPPAGTGTPPPTGPVQMVPQGPPMMVPASGPPPGAGSPPRTGPMQMAPPHGPPMMGPAGGPPPGPGSPPPTGPVQMVPQGPPMMGPAGGPPGPGSAPPTGRVQLVPPQGPPMEPVGPGTPCPVGPMQMVQGPPMGRPGPPGAAVTPLDVTRRSSGAPPVGVAMPQMQMMPQPRAHPLEILWNQSQMQAQRLNFMEGEIVDVKKMLHMMVERQKKASPSEDNEKASRLQWSMMAQQAAFEARMKEESSSPDSDGSFIANMRNKTRESEMQQLFEAMDTNHDGVLSREEFEQAERRAKLREVQKTGSSQRMPNPNQSIEFAFPVDRNDPFMSSDGYEYGDEYSSVDDLQAQTRDPDSMMSVEFHKRPELGTSLRRDGHAMFTPGGGSYDDPALGFGLPGQNPPESRTSMSLIKKDWNMDDKYIPNQTYEKDGAHHESISGNPIPSLPTVRQDKRDEGCQMM
eukprot:s985_g4.t3